MNMTLQLQIFIECRICHLLALSPLLKNDTEEYDLFLNQAISVLFRISLRTDRPDVAETALKYSKWFQIIKTMIGVFNSFNT